MHKGILKASSEAKKTVSGVKVELEKHGNIFHRTKLSRVLERGRESA